MIKERTGVDMQMTMQLVLVLCAFLSLIVALMVWRQRHSDSHPKAAGLPAALKGAQLVYAERRPVGALTQAQAWQHTPQKFRT